MLIPTKVITSAKGTTNKKDYREHLRAVCFDYDAEKNTLIIVGTNAQVMIVNTIAAPDPDFCKKYFGNRQAYFFNDGTLDPKKPYTEFTEIDGKLVCNGAILVRWDGMYPNWKVCIPEKDLTQATKYCGFNSELVKQLDKALGWKDTIMTRIPRVNTTDNEHLAPHRWDLNVFDNCDTIVVLMPMRLEQ